MVACERTNQTSRNSEPKRDLSRPRGETNRSSHLPPVRTTVLVFDSVPSAKGETAVAVLLPKHVRRQPYSVIYGQDKFQRTVTKMLGVGRARREAFLVSSFGQQTTMRKMQTI